MSLRQPPSIDMAIPPDLLRHAQANYGLLTREEIRAHGVSRDRLKRWRAAGQLEDVAPAVLRVGGAPTTWHQSLKAAVLSAGPGSAASHRSAAELWDLDGIDRGHVEVATHRKLPSTQFTVHRTFGLGREEIVSRQRIDVTDPTRTLLDLGSMYGPPKLERALESALRKNLTHMPLMIERFERWARRGRTGTRAWRAVLEDRAASLTPTASDFETLMSQILVRFDVKKPLRQYEIRHDGRFIKRPDFAYPEEMVAIEADSAAWHLGREYWQRDLAVNNELAALGWIVLRFTWDQVVKEPESVADTISGVLRSRSGAYRHLTRSVS